MTFQDLEHFTAKKKEKEANMDVKLRIFNNDQIVTRNVQK